MRSTLIILSLSVIGAVLFAVFRGGARTEYRAYQNAYRAALIKSGATVDYPVKLRQIVMRNGKIDRCVTCHVGMEDPRMANAPLPLKSHSGKFLEDHDIAKVGCTYCHDGQGRATTKKAAHANMADHWEQKRLLGDFNQAACVRCHAPDSTVMMSQFVRGRDLFRSMGCLGCHQLEGKGGRLAPDISRIGDASPHVKAPKDREALLKKFNGNLNLAYIYESIFAPKRQPQGSKMTDFHFTDEQAMALSVYLKSLSAVKGPTELQYKQREPRPVNGEELYGTYCSACHSSNGMGKNMKEFDKIAPAIFHPSFLAIADRGFVKERISDSGASIMPPWATSGGFTKEEISAITNHVMAKRGTLPPLQTVRKTPGNPRFGSFIFRKRCASCHGDDGKHELDLVGPTLSSPDWLSYADSTFVHRVVSEGRTHTAMPSWTMLSAEDYADLLAYFKSKRKATAGFAKVQAAMKLPNAVSWGKARFTQLCASCHGPGGEGGIGPSLNSPEFQTMATDQFLYDTIRKGRTGTAMGRQTRLSAEELGWVLGYIRTWRGKAKLHFSKGEVLGSESKGSRTFSRVCAQCHGPEGRGHIGPAIGYSSFLRTADDRFIKETAAYGRSGTGMKGNLHGQGGTASLSEREINEVVAYLRSQETIPRKYVGTATVQGDIPLGRKLFARTCAQCHGAAGSGGSGPGIGRPAFLSQVHDGFLQGTIANGRTDTEMKGFTQSAGGLAKLSDHEIRSVVAYLRSGVDVSKLTKKFSHGTAALGKPTFSGHCAQCHGSAAKESLAPHLLNPTFLKSASDGYLQGTMSLGRPGTAMRPVMRGGGGVVEMSSQEANNIIRFIRENATQK